MKSTPPVAENPRPAAATRPSSATPTLLFLLATSLLACSSSDGATSSLDASCTTIEAGNGTSSGAAIDATSSADAAVGAMDATPNADGAPIDASGEDASDGGDASLPSAPACMTHYLSPLPYLSGLDDPQWYIDNIPFLDVPDALTGSNILPIYYYRWSTLKRALRYTDITNGYVFLEFLEPPAYASAFGAINAAAGHHLYDARWLHDLRSGDDYLNYWLNGAGQSGVRQYSFWVADSAWARYEVSGDGDFVATDWVQIDMGTSTSINEVNLDIYNDTIGVVPPTAYSITTSLDGTTWQPAVHVQALPATPAAGPNVATFDPVAARYMRVTFTMSSSCAQGTGCVGLTELEAWVLP